MHNKLVKLIATFIFNKEKRRNFRIKHYKPTKLDILIEQNINLKNALKSAERNIKSLSNQMQLLHWYGNMAGTPQERKESFFKSLPKADGDLGLLQRILFKMLVDIDKICSENNINYWIQAGTLIGAYRHNGWIPWDDDLDIGMLEEDLNKLKKVLANNDTYKIEDFYHFRNDYIGKFTRIKFKDSNINCFLDIPVYQYFDGESLDEAWENIKQIREDFEQRACKLAEQLKKIYHNEVVTDIEDLQKIEAFYNEEISKLHKTNGKFIYWASYCVPARWKRIFEKDMFFPLAKLPFCQKEFNAPNKYKKYLKLQYGDIFTLPWSTKPKHVEVFNLYKNISILEEFCNEEN